MKYILISLLLVLALASKGQNIIEWDKDYELQFSDFQSPSTQVGETNIYSLHTGANIDFAFQMSNAEFMFTKNFNSKVICSFNRSGAYIIAPDNITASELLNFARYDFDLTELYARKFRQRMFESKGAFSSANFFRPLYDAVSLEHRNRHASAAKVTDLGREGEQLKQLHLQVVNELGQLSDFCKTCKPPKRKKKAEDLD
jgi:hypothetical protein